MTCWRLRRLCWRRTWVMRIPAAGGRGSPRRAPAGAGAIFAFPLSVGAIRTGVMGLYRSSPGPLPGTQLQ